MCRLCPRGGIGAGADGRPGQPGANCAPLGNVLIIQESDDGLPDDNAGGGVLCFSFVDTPVRFVSIGLLDFAAGRGDFLEVIQRSVTTPTRINIDGLGSNAVQSVDVDLRDVTSVCVNLLGEGAITNLEFCPDNGEDVRTTPEGTLSTSPSAIIVATESMEPSMTDFPTSPSVSNVPSTTPSDTPSGDATLTTSPNPTVDAGSNETTARPSGATSEMPTIQTVSGQPSSPSASEVPSSAPSDTPSSIPTVVAELNVTENPTLSASPSSGVQVPSITPSDVPSSALKEDSPVPTGMFSTVIGLNASCFDMVSIGFDTAGNGTLLDDGDYVGSEWFDRYGLNVSAFSLVGGFTPDNHARIFDTSNPQGDLDLGSPNR